MKRSNSVVRRNSSVKRLRIVSIEARHDRGPGSLYTIGKGEFNQLGINARAEKRKFPAHVERLADLKIQEVCAGGIHTIALTTEGKVYTFGCNDDKALGRDTDETEADREAMDEDEDEVDSAEDRKSRNPSIVEIKEKVVQISAGDSHSAALTDSGKVFAWGTFRDANGQFGLVPNSGEICIKQPVNILKDDESVRIVKIISGNNHLAMLSDAGFVYTVGSNEVGQLGRVQSERVLRGQADPKVFCLTPQFIPCGIKKFVDIWGGKASTFLKSTTGEIFVFGNNSNGQLGSDPEKEKIIAMPKQTRGFRNTKWVEISGGEHHTVALDSKGQVYTLGRGDDGRLGTGESEDSCHEPVLVQTLRDKECIHVAAGTSVSYAVTKENGRLYSWGFGGNWQLGQKEDDDGLVPQIVKKNVAAEDIAGPVRMVSGGGQHSAIVINL